ncbi:MAG TPA: protein kinase [Pyrinomonadaceae bacterium]|nr:protein kinase [Pyrinomonadaceae bacterium]
MDELTTNTTLSHYRIVSKLGAGGMGEVYLAEDSKLDRKVALKILPADVAGDETRMRRFVQEAKAASALNHPNIITIHEIQQIDSIHFIATEFIDGETLRERIRVGLKLSEVLDAAVQIASALSAAHAAGIVHRDIKPENIMIRHDGIAKVLDFGLAKPTERLRPESVDTEMATSIKTDPGTVVGTAIYMSPEQAKGTKVDERTDLWSLGAVLYEMMTGRPPFFGETPTETISLILQKEPEPLTRYAREVPAELERIVNKALTKNCDERYQSAKDLLIDLRNLKRKLEVDAEIDRTVSPEFRDAQSARSTGIGQSAPATASVAAATATAGATQTASSVEYIVSGIKRHKLAALITIVVLALAALALTAYLRSRNAEGSIDSIAVLPFENRSIDPETEYLSDGLAESLIYRLSQLPNLRVTPTSVALAYKGKQTDAIKAGNELGVSAVLSGRIIQRGDNLTISAELVDVRYNKLLWGEQYDRKMSDLLATQREIAREIVEKLRLKVSGQEIGIAKHYTESNEAYQLYLRGRFYWNKRTEEGMRKSLEYYQQAIERDPNFALAFSGLADSYDLLGAADASGGMPPHEAMPKAKAAALRALEIDDTLAEPHVSLAHVKYYYDRDWATAEREYKRAIELNPNYPTAHQWYAVYLMSAGRFDEAVAKNRRAQELDPLSLPINMTLGWVLFNARQYDQSAEQLRKTLEMDPNFALAHHRLGLVYEQQQKYDEAIAEFKQVVNLSPGKPLGIAALAHGYALSGNRAEAQNSLAELRELSKRRYVSPASIALIYAALGDKDRAFVWLEKADSERDANLARLTVDPRFDSLRSDPRFTDLVRRLGLH